MAVNGKKQGSIRQCPKCQKQYDNKAEYCGECGEKLVLLCGHCHFPVDETDAYCPECGAELQNKSVRKKTGWMLGIALLSIVVVIGCVGMVLHFNKKTSKATEQVDTAKTAKQLKTSSIVEEPATTSSSKIVQESTVAEQSAEKEVDLDTVLNANKEIVEESKAEENAKLNDEMIQIYTDKLYELSAENMEDIGYDCKFMLAYVDDDDIPELLVSEGFFHFSKVTIYVYQNKKLKKVDSLGQLGEMKYDERTGYVQGLYSDMGGDTYTYGRLKDGKLKDKIELIDSRDRDLKISEESDCWINNEAVSDDEYDTVYEQCEAGRNWTEVTYDNCYDVNDDDIYDAFEKLK